MGLDLSPCAVEFCQQRHQLPGLTFRQGDAEDLPLDNESADVVLNVESSHCYQSLQKFYGEVYRILRPGGYFLYADLMLPANLSNLESLLQRANLAILDKCDITAEVLQALGEDEAVKQQTIRDERIPAPLAGVFREFTWVQSSTNVWSLAARHVVYYRFVLQKSVHDVAKE